MAEYWQSLPRKFCDICKCWFADNKASIQFHERGKRHQENAAKRIREIQKKGIKQAKKEKELANEMDKIEKAALAAYEKDLKKMDGNVESYVDLCPSVKTHSLDIKEPKAKFVKKSLETVQKKIEEKLSSAQLIKKEPEESSSSGECEKIWYEAETEEGHKYYWNTQNSESCWEPPKEGFVSIEEQKEINHSSTDIKDEKVSSAADEPISCSIGPQPKIDPYGSWVTIQKEEPVEYDLQLPEQSHDVIEVVIPLPKEDRMKFKEKVVGRIVEDDESGNVTFKKRKLASSVNRKTRQRTTEDD